MPNGEGLSQDELYLILGELAQATPEEATRILERLIAEGRITQEQLNGIATWYSENIGTEKISPLAKRERQIAVDKAVYRALRDPDIPMEEKALIRSPEGQKLAKEYYVKGNPEFLNVLGQMTERAEGKRQEFREGREQKLSQVWEQLSRQPLTAPYLKDITETEVEAYLTGQSDNLLNKMSGIWEEANLAQRAQSKEAREAKRADVALAGIAELGKPPPKEEFVRPAMPGTEKVIKSFLGETGLAKGTKLRSFLAGQIIPGVLEETRGARERWWQRMHPEPVHEEDYTATKARLQEQARGWANLAWGPRASTEEVLGGTYWGPGGLAGRAETSYRAVLRHLGKLRPEDFDYEPAPATGPDPLIAALKKKKFRPEYYRQPGAGLVRALTPAVRY